MKREGKKSQNINNSNYQQLESARPTRLCLLMFVSPIIFHLHRLLSLSDWTLSRGEPTSDCYLCVIRRCTAEPNNTLPLIQPTVRAPPSWLHLIYVRFLRYLSATRPLNKKCGESHCVFQSFLRNTMPEWIQAWYGVSGAFPKHLQQPEHLFGQQLAQIPNLVLLYQIVSVDQSINSEISGLALTALNLLLHFLCPLFSPSPSSTAPLLCLPPPTPSFVPHCFPYFSSSHQTLHPICSLWLNQPSSSSLPLSSPLPHPSCSYNITHHSCCNFVVFLGQINDS